MSNIQLHENKLPTIQELYKDASDMVHQDQLIVLLNQQPPANWIKEHPYIKGYKYLPIEKTEYLLKKIFKKYRIEVLREGTSFNGVYVVVRVWYLNPLTGEMDFHDGIGAAQLQTKAGTSPTDLANINNGALSMAFPLAKTVAIKDACDHFGSLFGANLNRKDVLSFAVDSKLIEVVRTNEEKRLAKLIEKAKDRQTLDTLKSHLTESLQAQFDLKWNQLA